MSDRARVAGQPPAGPANLPDLLRAVVDNMQSGVVIYHLEDPDDVGSLRAIEANDAASQITGIDLAPYIGLTMREASPEALETPRPGLYARAALTGKRISLGDIKVDTPPLEGRVFSVNLVPLPGRCVAVMFEEVTERYRAEEELRAREEQFRMLADAAFEGVAVSDGGTILMVNQHLAEMVGHTAEDLIGQDLLSFVADSSREVMRDRVNSQSDEIHEITMIRRDGSTFPAEVRGRPFPYDGRIVRAKAFRDISERVRSVRRLERMRQRIELILNSAGEGIYGIDRDGLTTFANKAAAEMVGWTVDELIGKPQHSIIHHSHPDGEPYPLEDCPIFAVLKDGKERRVTDEAFWRKDGSSFPIEYVSTPIMEDGEICGAVVVFHDLTERRKVQDALDNFFDLSLDFLVITRFDGLFRRVNRAFARRLGYEHEELRQIRFAELIHPDDLDKAQVELANIEKGTPVPYFETRMRTRDGGHRLVAWSAQPYPIGQIVYAVGRDITDARAAEEALRRSEEQYRSVVSALEEGIVLQSREGEILTSNAAAERILGLTVAQLEGRTSIDPRWRAVREDGTPFPGEEHPAMAALGSGEPQRRVVMGLYRPSGDRRWISINAQPVFRDDEKQPYAVVTSFTDITERREAQAALERYASELEERNRELQQFAYVASHDLQEPLRMVSSFLQLLQRRYSGQLDETADEYIGFAVDGARRMQSLIQDLLAFSRVGSRGRPFEKVDLNDAVESVLADLRTALDETGGHVEYADLPTVTADPMQMRQLMQNLIGNALKFRGEEPPLIRIDSSRVGDQWQIEVRDNGIGIDMQYQDRVFQIFQRLHTRDEYEGTGIGLALCKRIVERHGGRIWLESERGAGTTFSFTLPVAPFRPAYDAVDEIDFEHDRS
jgi:PAS domain S-box-containing protein